MKNRLLELLAAGDTAIGALRVAIVQIEHIDAVARIDDILGVRGIDLVLICTMATPSAPMAVSPAARSSCRRFFMRSLRSGAVAKSARSLSASAGRLPRE